MIRNNTQTNFIFSNTKIQQFSLLGFTTILVACFSTLNIIIESQAMAQTLTGNDAKQQLLSTNQCPGCDLQGADLEEANLSSANLSGANLSGADLEEANLSGANLQNADFTGADLEDANLTNADVTGANFTGAKLQGVIGLNR